MNKGSPYLLLLIMAILHFLLMYVLMYIMVDRFSNVFPNLNQFYMAAIMTAPMIILEVFLMNRMYPNKKMNIILIAIVLVVLIILFISIRQQIAVSDEQFLKSMIPHHAGAILMCEKASINDAEIRELCRRIISSQQSEIDQMKSKLDEIG